MDPELTGFADATSRLVLVLGLFHQLSRVTDTDLPPCPESNHRAERIANGIKHGTFPPVSDLARYLFSFPTRSMDSFIHLVQQHHPCALLILFFYYHAVSLLLPEEQCWWSRNRARLLGPSIERALRANRDKDIETVLEEGERLLQYGPTGVTSHKSTLAGAEALGQAGKWVEVWEMGRSVLEKLGWQKGTWDAGQESMAGQVNAATFDHLGVREYP